MDLDHRRADRRRGFDLLRLAAMNSETRMPASAEFRTPARKRLALARGIEPAFGGALGAALGHDAGGVRVDLAGDRHHSVRRRHFQIERLVETRP